MSEFLAMGGYAAYVWPAYITSFLVLAGLVIISLRAHRRASQSVAALEGEGSVYRKSAAKVSETPNGDR